jgi:CDP-glycerol glycerophosphotransferase (TagB/SpsB family)
MKKCFQKYELLLILKLTIIIISLIFFCFIKKLEKKKSKKNRNNYLESVIKKFNLYKGFRKDEFIIFSDLFTSKYCDDINAYSVFEFYLKKNYNNAYYIINKESKLFKNLLNQHKTKNLILINGNETRIINDELFYYLANSKIIVQSYVIRPFQKITSKVSYLKYLYINHGITYFKSIIMIPELLYVRKEKRNIITSSPYEYNIFVNKFKYSPSYIYKAGIPRYDIYRTLKINKFERDCILVSFTQRKYNKSFFEKSIYKKNLERFLNNKSLIDFLQKRKINLIYIPHHVELTFHKRYQQIKMSYAKIKGQNTLTKYIKKCSLLVTDFSSISFAYMFLNKPVLFYLIDYNEKFKFREKSININHNYTLFFGHSFFNQEELIDKIKYYVNNNYYISKRLKSRFRRVFYYKDNIRYKIFNIINKLIY